jgi:hypothetical protein
MAIVTNTENAAALNSKPSMMRSLTWRDAFLLSRSLMPLPIGSGWDGMDALAVIAGFRNYWIRSIAAL